MPEQHNVLFLTDRGQYHQQVALDAAPPELAVTMMRRPPRLEVIRPCPSTSSSSASVRVRWTPT